MKTKDIDYTSKVLINYFCLGGFLFFGLAEGVCMWSGQKMAHYSLTLQTDHYYYTVPADGHLIEGIKLRSEFCFFRFFFRF